MPPATIVECVPNFSEGRDRGIVEQIAAAMQSVEDVFLLDIHMDADLNRSVLTFVGSRERIGEAALRGVGEAAALLDLNRHRGLHPRMGAADVLPFVPVRGVTLADCVAIAHRTGQEISRRFRIPVYFYEAAALRPERVNLSHIRRGEFEALQREGLDNPLRRPDAGEPRLHPTAGATAVGARRFLIALNVNLHSADLRAARQIARAIRASSGGLPAVKAIGLLLPARRSQGPVGQALVSINLTDFEQTSPAQVFQAVEREALARGLAIERCELVGLVPQQALADASPELLARMNIAPRQILENRLAEVLS